MDLQDILLLALHQNRRPDTTSFSKKQVDSAHEKLREEGLTELVADASMFGRNQLTIRGELQADVLLGVDSKKERQAFCTSVLRKAFEGTASERRGISVESVELTGNIGSARREGFFDELVELGYLSTTSIQAGFFAIGGYAITTKGERKLDAIGGRDTAELEQRIKRTALLALLQKEENHSCAVIGSTPFSETAKHVGPKRMEKLLDMLVQEGFLEATSMQSGLFRVGGYYKFTDKGRRRAKDMVGTPDLAQKSCPKRGGANPYKKG
jgi:DNA-binding PadR family transcriptional regulator